jgi:hypothetical protein
MALYSGFKYNDGTLYGDGSPLDYSALPITAIATRYNEVIVDYAAPTGSYILFRLVRNQDGYPETAEDGKVVYSTAIGEYPTGDPVVDTGLVEGKFAYYRAWLQRQTNSYWEPAGDAFVLVPSRHTLTSGTSAVQSVINDTTGIFEDVPISAEVDFSTTHQRFLSYLPQVLTSTSLSPVDEIDSDYNDGIDKSGAFSNTFISRFFEGFSFTIDEFLTLARIIIPSSSGESLSPEILKLKSFELGIKPYNELAIQSQKRLVRDALTIYGGKGTLNSLQLFTKDLTGYTTDIVETANLMLSHEESTFDIEDWIAGESIGSWLPGDGVTLEVTSDKPISTTYPNSLDSTYCLKVSTTGSSQSLSYGTNNPINNAIPVEPSTLYTVSTLVQGSANITLNILWYNSKGTLIQADSGSSVSTSSNWSRKSVTATSPDLAVYAGFRIDFASTGSSTYHLDMVQFEKSNIATDYIEPRGVIVDLLPSKYNFLSNPSFEVASSDVPTEWVFTDVTAVQVDSSLNIAPGSDFMAAIVTPSESGDYLGEIESSYSGNLLTSKFYTFSIYAASLLDPQDLSVVITDGTTEFTQQFTVTENWQRLSVSASFSEVPSTLTVKVVTTTSSSEFYLDTAQLEEGSAATDYFDGDRTYDGAAWTGTPQESPSVYYPNKSLRVAHLMDSIEEYLPISTPYYVTFYDSDTFTEVALSGIS